MNCRLGQSYWLPQLPGGTEVSAARPASSASCPPPTGAPPRPPNQSGAVSASPQLSPTVVTHTVVRIQALPGRGADGADWVIGSHGSPVMGRNAHVIFREFREVFGSRHLTVRHKESIVCLPSPFSCAQVINADSIIVTAVAGMAGSLQALTSGTEMDEQKPPTSPPHSPLPPSPPRSHQVAGAA